MACNHNFDELIDLVCNLIQDINHDELADNLTRLFRPINDILSRLDGPPLDQALYQLNQRVFAAHRARASITHPDAPNPASVFAPLQQTGSPTQHAPHDAAPDAEANVTQPVTSDNHTDVSPKPYNSGSYKKDIQSKPRGDTKKRKKGGAAGDEGDAFPDESPIKRRNAALRKPDGTEVLLQGKKLTPDQVQDIVHAELKRRHVLPLSRKYPAESYLREAAIAIAEGNGSYTMCERIIRLFATMFSGESLIGVGRRIYRYCMLQASVDSRRRQNEQARIDGTADHGTRGMISLNNPIYDTFVRSLDACILTARDLQLSDFTLMEVVLKMHDAYNAFMDSLSREDEKSRELLHRAEENRARIYSEARKPTVHEAAIINAMLDLHPEGGTHKFFEEQRKVYQRIINIGNTIATLSTWGWGSMFCLLDSPWQDIFEHVNVELLRAASAAIIRIDQNVEHTFQNLTNRAVLPMFENQPLDFPFLFQRYLQDDLMYTSGKRYSFADLLDRDTTGGPGAAIMPSPSTIGSSTFGVPSPSRASLLAVSPAKARRRRALLAPDSDDEDDANHEEGSRPSPGAHSSSRRAMLAPDSDSDHEKEDMDKFNGSPVRRSTTRPASARGLSLRARSSIAPSHPSVSPRGENNTKDHDNDEHMTDT